jgi:hypothetical protein
LGSETDCKPPRERAEETVRTVGAFWSARFGRRLAQERQQTAATIPVHPCLETQEARRSFVRFSATPAETFAAVPKGRRHLFWVLGWKVLGPGRPVTGPDSSCLLQKRRRDEDLQGAFVVEIIRREDGRGFANWNHGRATPAILADHGLIHAAGTTQMNR